MLYQLSYAHRSRDDSTQARRQKAAAKIGSALISRGKTSEEYLSAVQNARENFKIGVSIFQFRSRHQKGIA